MSHYRGQRRRQGLWSLELRIGSTSLHGLVFRLCNHWSMFGGQQHKHHLLIVAEVLPHVTFNDMCTHPLMACYNRAL